VHPELQILGRGSEEQLLVREHIPDSDIGIKPLIVGVMFWAPIRVDVKEPTPLEAHVVDMDLAIGVFGSRL